MSFLCRIFGVSATVLFLIGDTATGSDVATASVFSEAPLAVTWAKDLLEFKPAPGTKQIRGAFGFTNKSQVPVVLSRVDPNCGCLKIASFPKETAPGESGAIAFVYEAAGKEGMQTARIDVQFGDSKRDLQTLRLRLDLSPRFSVVPGVVLFEKADTSKESTITILDPDLSLNREVTTTGGFVAKLIPLKNPVQFLLQLDRPTTPGQAEGWAKIAFTDGANKPIERKIRLIAN